MIEYIFGRREVVVPTAAGISDMEEKLDISGVAKKYMPDLKPYHAIYKDLHQHPELGKQESRTAGIAAEGLRKLGYQVKERIGGYGVVGILKNGVGKTILLRADMDALPIEEATGLPYASRVQQKNGNGDSVPVMAACGHDMHVACMLAVAKLLMDAKSHWTGTLICLFQPNEEGGAGAQAMVDDGLYKKIPIPDLILGQHVDHRRAGTIAIVPGTFMATANSFDVVIHGQSGHGSQPQFTVDPILTSAYILVKLQSIVSRMVAPLDAAVVTCGSIHSGNVENIIPEKAELKINIRTYSEPTRKKVLDALDNIIRCECRSAGTPREPEINPTTDFPLTVNDTHVAQQLRATFTEHFGEKHTEKMEKLAGSEDISNLAKPYNTPYAFWFWGGTEPARWDQAVKDGKVEAIPRNHSAKFAPVIEPTMTTGVQALSLAALRYLARS